MGKKTLSADEYYKRAKGIFLRLRDEYARIAGPWEMWKIGRHMKEIDHPAQINMQEIELFKGYEEVQHSLGLTVTQGIARMLDNPNGKDTLCLEALKGCIGCLEVRMKFLDDASKWLENIENEEEYRNRVEIWFKQIIKKTTYIRNDNRTNKLKDTRDQYLSHNLVLSPQLITYKEVGELWEKIKEIIKLSSLALTLADFDTGQRDDFFKNRAKVFWSTFEKGLDCKDTS